MEALAIMFAITAGILISAAAAFVGWRIAAWFDPDRTPPTQPPNVVVLPSVEPIRKLTVVRSQAIRREHDVDEWLSSQPLVVNGQIGSDYSNLIYLDERRHTAHVESNLLNQN